MRIETQLIHAGEPRPQQGGAVVTPIYQSSTFVLGDASGYHDIRYIRLNNTPSHDALHAKLAALEGTEAALVTASGMAAISSSLLSQLSAGDHVIAHECLYGGTHDFFKTDLPRLGITTTFVDADKPASWAAAVTPRTRVFYVEAITNPILEVVDFDAVVAFAKARGLVSMIDATLTSPVNFRPAGRGFDLVLHSATKYLNGHSDIVAGVVAGRGELVRSIKHKLDHLGGCLDPHACFLLHRGLKTLALRVRHQSQSALEIARFLERHEAVASVLYPGLESHPQHRRARELFAGMGGIVSFRPRGGVAAAERFVSTTRLGISAPSLGGPETLVSRPVVASHAGVARADRDRLGITDDLVRLSIGLEAPEDLIEDFARALAG
jgi:cystathionine beta-lyase/cystathionine gamma-synthase